MLPQIQPPCRGVYTPEYYDAAGDFLAVAINSKGRRIAELPYKASTRDEAIRTLVHLLDLTDPVRRLHVL